MDSSLLRAALKSYVSPDCIIKGSGAGKGNTSCRNRSCSLLCHRLPESVWISFVISLSKFLICSPGTVRAILPTCCIAGSVLVNY